MLVLALCIPQNSQHAAFWQSNGAPQGAQLCFFSEPASLRCASSFRRARASGSVGRKQTAMRSGDSGFAFGSWRQRNSLGFPERSSDARKPGRGVGVLEGTRFIIQHVLLHYRG